MATDLTQRLIETEKLFRKACEQFTILNRQVEELSVRFQEADSSGNRILRYNIRLRMSVMEGVRNMFYEFAAIKSTEIVELQRRVLEDVIIDDDSDSDISGMLGFSEMEEYSSDLDSSSDTTSDTV